MLRVSAPAVYGAMKVAPLMVGLQRKHPGLDVQLQCEDRMIDMLVERIDVAVRVLATPPAEFVARPIDDRRGLYASPSYLRHGRPPKGRVWSTNGSPPRVARFALVAAAPM